MLGSVSEGKRTSNFRGEEPVAFPSRETDKIRGESKAGKKEDSRWMTNFWSPLDASSLSPEIKMLFFLRPISLIVAKTNAATSPLETPEGGVIVPEVALTTDANDRAWPQGSTEEDDAAGPADASWGQGQREEGACVFPRLARSSFSSSRRAWIMLVDSSSVFA